MAPGASLRTAARPWSRLLAGLALLAASSAQAYSALYVFGDSLSDSGNNALAIGADPSQVITGNGYVPTQPYGTGTYSNGPVWAQTFAAALGLSAQPSLAGGTNFAFGGAQTRAEDAATRFPPSLLTQTASFLAGSGGTAPADALYVVAGGGNNARAALAALGGGADPLLTLGASAQQFASDIGTLVDTLQAAGARQIVVWNVPNLGFAPAITALGPQAAFLGASTASALNAALGARLSGEPGVALFDLYSLLPPAVATSFSNLSDACGAPSARCDPATALFWDGIHPTAAGHALIAQAMLVTAVPEPQTYALFVAGLAALGAVARRRSAGAPRR